jgi:hypothetical protein
MNTGYASTLSSIYAFFNSPKLPPKKIVSVSGYSIPIYIPQDYVLNIEINPTAYVEPSGVWTPTGC